MSYSLRGLNVSGPRGSILSAATTGPNVSLMVLRPNVRRRQKLNNMDWAWHFILESRSKLSVRCCPSEYLVSAAFTLITLTGAESVDIIVAVSRLRTFSKPSLLFRHLLPNTR